MARLDSLWTRLGKDRPTRIKRGLMFGCGVLLLALIVWSFLPSPVAVDLGTVAKGRLEVTVDDDGETRVKERYVVAAPAAGRLERIAVEEGDPVVAGQTVLATILPADPSFLSARDEAQAEARAQAARASKAQADANLGRAKAALAYAKTELDRSRSLAKEGTIPQKALDQAELDVELKTAELDSAQSAVHVAAFDLASAEAALMGPNRGDTQGAVDKISGCCIEIRAPVTGMVLTRHHESETVVPAGEPLIDVGDPKDIEIVADLLSTDAVKLQPGAHVYIDHWGGPKVLNGRLRLIEPSGFTKISALGIEEQRVNVRIDITDPYEEWVTLGDGFRVEVRVVAWAGDDVIKVPVAALFRDAEGWAVFVDADGRADLRQVTIGHRNDREAEVLEGLKDGDTVILHPGDQVTDGVRVSER
jgi:HlyD family secretion protein